MNVGALTELAAEIRRRGLCWDWQAAPDLGALLISGTDCPQFLQAQLSSDVLALAPGRGQLTARLNRKGQLQAWFSLHRLPDRGQPYPSYLGLLPRSEIPSLIHDLEGFVISEDVAFADLSADFDGWVAQAPLDADLAESLPARLWQLELPEPLAELDLALERNPSGREIWVLKRSLNGDPGWLFLSPRDEAGTKSPVAGEPVARDLDLVSDAAVPPAAARLLWRWLMAEAGWPELGRDLRPATRVLAQTGLEMHLVSNTKGCYLGQEVVARIRTYASVPEALRAVIWSDLAPEDLDLLPASETPCLADAGRKLGTWASSFWSPVLQKCVSLAFLKRDERTPGRRLTVAGPDDEWTGEVALLPLHMAVDAEGRAARLHDLALQHFSAGRDEEAVAGLEAALGLDPSRAEAFEALGVILGRLGKYHEAIDIFRRLEEVAPSEPMVHTNLSLFYMKIGDKDEAEHQKALGTMKRFGVGVDAEQAEALARQERETRRDEALRRKEMFAEVLAIDPDDALALMGMGRALDTLEEPAAAAEYLQQALKQQDQNSALYASCGKVLEKLGRDEEAVALFRRGIEVASRKGDLMPLKEMEHRLRLLER